MTAHFKVRKNNVEKKYNQINVNLISRSFVVYWQLIDDLFSPMDSRGTAVYKDRMANDP